MRKDQLKYQIKKRRDTESVPFFNYLLYLSRNIVQRIPRLSRTRDGENGRRLFISSRSGEESRHFGNSSFFLSDLSACCPFERDKCGTSWHSKIFRATRRKSGINKRLPLLPVPTSQSHPTDRPTERPTPQLFNCCWQKDKTSEARIHPEPSSSCSPSSFCEVIRVIGSVATFTRARAASFCPFCNGDSFPLFLSEFVTTSSSN